MSSFGLWIQQLDAASVFGVTF